MNDEAKQQPVEQPAQQESTVQMAVEKRIAPKKSSQWPLYAIGVLVAGLIGYQGYNFYMTRPSEGLTAAKGLVTIDPLRLVKASVGQQMEIGKVDPRSSVEFAEKIKDQVQAYSRDGYIVVSGEVVMAAPNGSDITPIVAKKLGVDLSYADKIDSSLRKPSISETK